jgi:hypothetical protein
MDAADQLEREIARAREGEAAARSRAYRELLQLSGAVEHLRRLQRSRRLERQLARLEGLSDGEDRQRLRSLRDELERTGESGQEAELAHVEGTLDEMSKKLRGQPYGELLLDLMALGGRRVSPHQHALFNKASSLIEEIDRKGGVEALTESDRDRLLACHRDLAVAHPELGSLRAKVLEDLHRQGRTAIDLRRGDLERATSGPR